jgi:hypothetical protein
MEIPSRFGHGWNFTFQLQHASLAGFSPVPAVLVGVCPTDRGDVHGQVLAVPDLRSHLGD